MVLVGISGSWTWVAALDGSQKVVLGLGVAVPSPGQRNGGA